MKAFAVCAALLVLLLAVVPANAAQGTAQSTASYYEGSRYYSPKATVQAARKPTQFFDVLMNNPFGRPDGDPVYYGYAAVCDDSMGLELATASGPLRDGAEEGNLQPALVSCASAPTRYTLQVGGYCAAKCHQTGTRVTELGATSSWYSDDTRSIDGTVLNGQNSSYPGYGFSRPPSEADDIAIANNLFFGTYNETDGSPTGVMKLFATTMNPGKASVRFYRPFVSPPTLADLEIVPGSALADITAAFRWYQGPLAPQGTVGQLRTPAFNLLVVGNNNITYTMSWVGGGSAQQGWNEAEPNFSLDPSTRGWGIFCSPNPTGNCTGTPPNLNASLTMQELLADSRWGPYLLGGSVVGVGFNLGSSQRNCYVGIDWLETNLLNGGARVDFGPPGPFPTIGLGAATIGGDSDDFISPPTGWTWGIGSPAPDIPAQTTCFGPAITTAGVKIETECANVATAVCCAPRAAP